MRFWEIISETTVGRNSYLDKLVANPFHNSVIKQEMYHGSNQSGLTKFNRNNAGIWFAEYPEWSQRHYAGAAGEVYVCWIDVRNPYTPTDDENDQYYGEMDLIPELFERLTSQGHDAYIQGGESGSIAVFGQAKIVNALTGQAM